MLAKSCQARFHFFVGPSEVTFARETGDPNEVT